MIQRAKQLITSCLALCILAALHAIHGATLLLTLFLHLYKQLSHTLPFSILPSILRRYASPLVYPSEDILRQDKARWTARKIPNCLGVVFVPAARGYFSFRELSYRPWQDEVVLDGMLKDVVELFKWIKELEVDSLLLYDEKGILKKHTKELQSALQRHLLAHKPGLSKYEGKKANVLDQISSSTFICDGIRISLLAEEDGKQHLATVTTGIHKAVSTGYIAKEDVDVDFVQEKVYSSSCPEPDLLMVLGGLHLRLRGFPPWHVRLCEIYHDSSLGLLGPPRLRYSAFQRAMDNYAGCEQRLGR